MNPKERKRIEKEALRIMNEGGSALAGASALAGGRKTKGGFVQFLPALLSSIPSVIQGIKGVVDMVKGNGLEEELLIKKVKKPRKPNHALLTKRIMKENPGMKLGEASHLASQCAQAMPKPKRGRKRRE